MPNHRLQLTDLTRRNQEILPRGHQHWRQAPLVASDQRLNPTASQYGSIMNKIPIVFSWVRKEPIKRLLFLVNKSAKVFLVDTIYLCDICVYLVL